MKWNAEVRRPKKITLVACMVALLGGGCKFGPKKKFEDPKPVAAARNASDPDIDLNCIIDHIQNPPEAFHYSFKRDNVDEEADLTPQTIDGTTIDQAGVHPFHGVRSDKDSWQNAWPNLTAVSSTTSLFLILGDTGAQVREGAESVNGYDTIKYSIDTARASGIQTTLLRSTLGSGGFEKGAAWVTSQGCPVKFSLDVEMHLNDGSAQKEHFEEAMIKK